MVIVTKTYDQPLVVNVYYPLSLPPILPFFASPSCPSVLDLLFVTCRSLENLFRN